ncbi:MAG: ShlB/FhaC/HecB family hemolysin secretion/activation protein [Pseudomonadota bacterium]
MVCLSSIPAVVCWSAAPEDAAATDIQQQLRQQERDQALRRQQSQTPDVQLQTKRQEQNERLPTNEAPCFKIHTIVLQGESAELFQWALAAASPPEDPAIGSCLGGQGINLVMKRVQNAIVERGYVTTRVVAGQQNLGSGTFTLTLIPGRVRDIGFAANTSSKASYQNALPIAAGDLLNLRDLEQGLENFKRLPTAEADIRIVPSATPDATAGDSDIEITWQQGRPYRVALFVDDSGTKSTGRYQGGATLSIDHALTLNDVFYVGLNHGLSNGSKRGTRGANVHYSIPFDYWLFGVSASNNRYLQTVQGVDQTYQYSGNSSTAEVKLSRLVYRDAVRKTTLSAKSWLRMSKNFLDDTEIDLQRRRTAGWEVSANHREFIGFGTLDTNLTYRRGTGALGSRAAPEEASGEGTARPRLWVADAQLITPLTVAGQSLRYVGAVRAQWSRSTLVPQDRFVIGGRYSVRGFDGESVLLGDRGWLIRNDIGLAIGDGAEAYLSIDYGQVSGPSSAKLVGTTLAGAVIGVRGAKASVNYDLFAGAPLKKPAALRTASVTSGFNLSHSF